MGSTAKKQEIPLHHTRDHRNPRTEHMYTKQQGWLTAWVPPGRANTNTHGSCTWRHVGRNVPEEKYTQSQDTTHRDELLLLDSFIVTAARGGGSVSSAFLLEWGGTVLTLPVHPALSLAYPFPGPGGASLVVPQSLTQPGES